MDATVAQYGNALEAIVEMKPTVGTVTQLLKVREFFLYRRVSSRLVHVVDECLIF